MRSNCVVIDRIALPLKPTHRMRHMAAASRVSARPQDDRSSWTPWGLVLLALATAGIVSCSNGSDASHSEPPASSSQSSAQFNDADVEYAEGMIMHHEQAIEMSDIVLDKSGIDPDVATLAKQIKQVQGPEIKQMQSWPKDLDDGMMSPEDLKDLKEAGAENASKLFLDQMIEHHEGAVTMAEQHREESEDSEAVELSANVLHDQNAEIKDMRKLRAAL